MTREVISDRRIVARFMKFVKKGDDPDRKGKNEAHGWWFTWGVCPVLYDGVCIHRGVLARHLQAPDGMSQGLLAPALVDLGRIRRDVQGPRSVVPR